jgi:hypothetical protein
MNMASGFKDGADIRSESDGALQSRTDGIREGTAAPPTLGVGKRLLFSLIIAVLVFSTLEVSASVFLRFTRGYAGGSLLHYEYDAYKILHPARGYIDNRGLSHNLQGFRHPVEVDRTKPDGVYRIFLMGGSTAYGSGTQWSFLQSRYRVIRDDETITHYLRQSLGTALPEVEIELINAAIPTVWTHHHTIYLNQTILGFDPDMILFLDGNNDHFHYEDQHDQFAGYLYSNKARLIMGEPTFRSLASGIGWWLYRKSAFFHIAMEETRSLVGLVRNVVQRSPSPEAIDEEAALAGLRLNLDANVLRVIERNGRMVRAEGVRPVFLLQPLLIMEGRRQSIMSDVESRMFDFMVASSLPGWEGWARRAVPLVADRVSGVADQVGGTFLDLTGIYEGQSDQMFTDYCHLTPAGNRILADNISNHIVPLILADLH